MNKIKNEIKELFRNNACGTQPGRALNDKLLPVVQFASKHTIFISNNDERELRWMYEQFSYLLSLVDDEKLKQKGAVLLGQPKPILKEWYKFILDNWEQLKNLSQTYTVLFCIVTHTKWKDSRRERCELEQIKKA